MRKLKVESEKLKVHSRKGVYLPVIILVSTMFIAYAVMLSTFAFSNVKMADLHNKKITATSIAEAGVNYYLWHLSHDEDDYCDGGTCSGQPPYGPFTHNYTDQGGIVLGNYDIYVTPPEDGQSTVTVRVVGRVNGTSPEKVITAELGIPYFTKYTLLVSNDQLWVGDGETIDGTIHVNNSGVRMDGEVTGDISSAVSQYTTDWFGDTCETLYPELEGDCPGIWSYNPGAVFGGSKLFPVTPVDMNQVNVDIASLYQAACISGQGLCLDGSGEKGFHLVLGSDGIMVNKVKKFDSSGLDITQYKGSGTLYPYPANGIIYSTEDIWLNGTIDGQRLTIVAALSNRDRRIVVPESIRYTNYDGSDTIGLISQSDIVVSRNAPADMEIDAAMIAKDGLIYIPYFGEIKASPSKIKVYGSMAHQGGLLWTYADGNGTVVGGYRNTETVIDPHNILSPPPQFPKTGTYSVLSWREE